MTRTTAIALLMSAALPLGAAAQQETTTTTTDTGSTVTTTAPTTSEAPARSPAGGSSAEAPAPSPASGSSAEAPAPSPAGDGAAPAQGDFRQAGGTLRNGEDVEIGSVIVTETASGVMHFILDIGEGTLPAQQHSLHLHEEGVCEGPTFESAGGHLADEGQEHGVHSANGPHLGDLPNITMGPAGALHVEYFLPGLLLERILDDNGSAVVIHSGVDDYTSQPAGNAGDRIACAVLELTEG